MRFFPFARRNVDYQNSARGHGAVDIPEDDTMILLFVDEFQILPLNHSRTHRGAQISFGFDFGYQYIEQLDEKVACDFGNVVRLLFSREAEDAGAAKNSPGFSEEDLVNLGKYNACELMIDGVARLLLVLKHFYRLLRLEIWIK